MLMIQAAVITLLFLVFSGLVISLFFSFHKGFKYTIYFIIPLFIFSLGFFLRLTSSKPLINMGYYFTDFTSLFIYCLFAITFLLGQLKYWKK